MAQRRRLCRVLNWYARRSPVHMRGTDALRPWLLPPADPTAPWPLKVVRNGRDRFPDGSVGKPNAVAIVQVPVGGDENAQREFAQKKVARAASRTKVLASRDNIGFSRVQVAFLLLRYCVNPQVNYFCRNNIPTPAFVQDVADGHDKTVLDTFCYMMDIDPVELTPSMTTLIRLPFKYGGFGLRAQEWVCYAGYVAAWAMTFQILYHRDQAFAQTVNEAMALPLADRPAGLRALSDCIDRLLGRREYEGHGLLDPEDDFASELLVDDEWTPQSLADVALHLQRRLSASVEKKVYRVWLSELSPMRRLIHEACLADGGAHLWMRQAPTEPSLVVCAWVFWILLRIILGLPHPLVTALEQQFAEEGRGEVLCRCGKRYDALLVEGSSCMHCPHPRFRSHHAIVRAIAHTIAEQVPGAQVIQETHVPGCTTRADLVVQTDNGTFVGEVTTRNVSAQSHAADARRGGVPAILRRAEQTKEKDYDDLDLNLFQFFVGAFTLQGRFNPALAKALDGLYRSTVTYGSDQFGSPAAREKALKAVADFKKAWRARVSVALATTYANQQILRLQALATAPKEAPVPFRDTDGKTKIVGWRNGGGGMDVTNPDYVRLRGFRRSRAENERAEYFLRRKFSPDDPFDPSAAALALGVIRPGALPSLSSPRPPEDGHRSLSDMFMSAHESLSFLHDRPDVGGPQQ